MTFEHDMVTAPDPAFLENGMGKRLSTQVPTEVFANASRAWANLGLNPARLEQLQPWVAAMAIVITGAATRGIQETHWVDNVLWGRAEQDGKTRTTLEKPDEALAIFSRLSAYEASSFLNYSTNPVTAFQNDLDVMMKAWHEHDEVTMERILDHRLRMWPAGFAQLITGRNRAWMPTLLQLAADNVPTLVVVGALHCVGMDGLPRL